MPKIGRQGERKPKLPQILTMAVTAKSDQLGDPSSASAVPLDCGLEHTPSVFEWLDTADRGVGEARGGLVLEHGIGVKRRDRAAAYGCKRGPQHALEHGDAIVDRAGMREGRSPGRARLP